MSNYLGLDIGGTKIFAVLTDDSGKVLAERKEPTETSGPEALVAQIAALAARLGGDAPLGGIGIGLPASVDPKTKALSLIPNIAGMEGEGFYQALRQQFDLPIVLENDVNAAALAEAEAGDPMAFIAIGTGIGMGLVSEGQLLRGAKGAAGEIAYLPLGGDAKAARAAGCGTLEERLGGEGWRVAYRAKGGLDPVDLKALFEAPDAIFEAVLAEQADLLAQAILAISAVVAPEVFVFGGSIGSQPRLIAAVEARLGEYCLDRPPLRRALFGPKAGALGAARAIRPRR